MALPWREGCTAALARTSQGSGGTALLHARGGHQHAAARGRSAFACAARRPRTAGRPALCEAGAPAALQPSLLQGNTAAAVLNPTIPLPSLPSQTLQGPRNEAPMLATPPSQKEPLGRWAPPGSPTPRCIPTVHNRPTEDQTRRASQEPNWAYWRAWPGDGERHARSRAACLSGAWVGGAGAQARNHLRLTKTPSAPQHLRAKAALSPPW